MRPLFTRLAVVACIATLALPGLPADACTSFLLKHPDAPFMAKNYDWDVADGILVVNPRGLAKTALVPDGSKPARWTSRYGSVSFNQYGREFPVGGINEVGLVMEVLWLAGSTYPEKGDRDSIGTLQWVQYCLDSFRTVSDVVASASDLNIGGPAPLHFLTCDPTSNCAVIEFLDGKVVTRSERTLPLPVLANDTYNDSLQYLNRTLGYGGDPIEPEGTGSLARYARAARGSQDARRTASDQPIDDAFAILADVAQPGSTQWSIVYELHDTKVHFRSSGNPKTRTVDLSRLDLDCTSDALMIDLLGEGSGDVTSKLVVFDAETNLTTIRAGFAAESVAAPADEIILTMASYPDKLLCTFEARAE